MRESNLLALVLVTGLAAAASANSCTLNTMGEGAPYSTHDAAIAAGSGGSPIDAQPEADAGKDVGKDHSVEDAHHDTEVGDVVSETCFAGSKWCGTGCVPITSPDYGCAQDTCSPCVIPNAKAKCEGETCVIDTCNVPFQDCNNKVLDGCETPLNTLTDCAACGQGCSPAHATGDCSDGQSCAIKQCEQGYDNCNTMPADGCEVFIWGDKDNCGTCNHVCVPPATGDTMKCSPPPTGCEIDNCNPPTQDCNHDNVCEINTDTDPNNCGSCGHACSYTNAVGECTGGVCHLKSCEAGYGDCNGNPSDGCETNTLTNKDHCGKCAAPCSTANGTNPTCDQGQCSLTCNTGFGNCNGPKPGDDPGDDGCEVNLQTDKAHCGSCAAPCKSDHGSAPTCTGGKCSLTCDTGYLDCNGPVAGADAKNDGCEVHKTDDELNCGACGTVCNGTHGTPTCANGQCGITCTSGYGNCDGLLTNGCEINLSSDIQHCGLCTTVCNNANGTATCSSGQCGITCNNGWGNCDNNAGTGCESNLTTDELHCGVCATACSMNHGATQCIGGSCQVQTCSPGFGNCDGNAANACETATTTDVSHCGTCASGCNGACPAACNTPNATPKCTTGICGINACNSGYLDCDSLVTSGCEINGQTDPNHCGSCTKVCSSVNGNAGCSLGGCTIQCNTLFGNCDNNVATGCEKPLATDTSNCGLCGKICESAHGTAACSSGVCSITCDSGWGDCTTAAGCETPLNTLTNCGSCGTACSGKNANWSCAGVCTVTSCVTNYGNCNGQDSDGCEAAFLSDINHCGDCATQCTNGKTCQAGICKNP